MAFRTVKSSGKAPPLSSSVTSLRGLERLNCNFCYALLGSNSVRVVTDTHMFRLFGFVLHSKAIAWSPYVNDLASGDWTPDRCIATLTCHAYRVMYVVVSPDGQTIVTRAGDETLRFWNVFPSMKTQEVDQRSRFDRTASAFSSAPLDTPTADHQLKRRELVYLFRVVYLRMEIIGVCGGQKHYKLEIAYLNKVRCLSLESGAEGDFNALGFLQVPGFDDIFNGDDDTYRIRKLGLMWISLSSPTATTF
ncbi:hypothetical protein DY000_02046195 [Brassica cretica]|uniref:Uncharacterized protein n=1 Tax=Brassica cretica TaxID=69181 RepID=A0ABQ7F6V1_BRACR|nr:hypothetical protein DY000_02046195 [Brassica cretica]